MGEGTKKRKRKVDATLVQKLVEDIPVEDEVPILERITYPLVWERMALGVRVEDLHPERYNDALALIKDYYFKDEVLCRGVGMMEDEDSQQEFLYLVSYWLKDTQSLAAIEEGTSQLVGILVGRVVDKSSYLKTFSRMTVGPEEEEEECVPNGIIVDGSHHKHKSQGHKEKPKRSDPHSPHMTSNKPIRPMFSDPQMIYQGRTLKIMQHLRMHLHKSIDIFSIYDVDAYYRVYLWMVIPNFRGCGVGRALMKAAMSLTKRMKLKIVTGTFTSYISQNLVYKLGFVELGQVLYGLWVEDNEEVFKDIDPGSYAAIVMAVKLQDLPPPPPPPEVEPPRRKKSRQQGIKPPDSNVLSAL